MSFRPQGDKDQPKDTIGKCIMYRPLDGHWHKPHPADELNWRNATIGRIFEYRIMEGK